MPETGNAAESVERDGWETYLAGLVKDKTVIVAFEVLAAMTRKVADLERWGARRPLLIARGTGTGPLPDESDADIVLLPAEEASSMTEDVRLQMAGPVLPPEVVDLVERRDPNREALWWVSPVNHNEPILGRRVIGGRTRAQAAMEDKLAADALWDAVGVERAVAAVTAAAYEDLQRASERVRTGAGADSVVWSGDTRDGVNGGGDYVRWIRTDAHAVEAAAFFTARCDRVRVMPFLEGVPCSIHGIVMDDGVAVFRPLELGILRRPADGTFFYGGMGTLWDPPDAERDRMRDAARRVGRHLDQTKRYRGGFAIDGVMTASGFRPTELNPRFSGGLSRFARGAPELQMELLQLNLMAGREAQITAAGYEEVAVAALDDLRFFDAMGISTHVRADTNESLPVAYEHGRLRVAHDGDDLAGEILRGPSAMGTFVRFASPAGLDLAGGRCAEIAIDMLALADDRWCTAFGHLEMAPDVSG